MIKRTSSAAPASTLGVQSGSVVAAEGPKVNESEPKTTFPFDLSKYSPPKLDPWKDEEIPAAARPVMDANVELVRDSIVAFTACASAAGLGGHTGGAFDIVPEVTIIDAMFKTSPDKFVPIMFDEAGHRVAVQYLWLALNGQIDPDNLKNYRRT
jgi:hypothetical protein